MENKRTYTSKYLHVLWLIICLTATLSVFGQGVTSPAPARQERVGRRVERHTLGHRENDLFLTLSTGMTSHNQMVGIVKLEYSRQIKRNWYWGTTFTVAGHSSTRMSYDWSGMGWDPYSDTADQDIYKLSGMVFYRAPVIRSRLFFRIGAGAGVGYHRIRSLGNRSKVAGRALPYLTVEGAWILRAGKHFEMKFAPLILLVPSEVSWSLVNLQRSSDLTPWLLDAGVSLTLGCRF